MKTIETLKDKLSATTEKKEVKRLRNMISAYESRIQKRETVEQLR